MTAGSMQVRRNIALERHQEPHRKKATYLMTEGENTQGGTARRKKHLPSNYRSSRTMRTTLSHSRSTAVSCSLHFVEAGAYPSVSFQTTTNGDDNGQLVPLCAHGTSYTQARILDK